MTNPVSILESIPQGLKIPAVPSLPKIPSIPVIPKLPPIPNNIKSAITTISSIPKISKFSVPRITIPVGILKAIFSLEKKLVAKTDGIRKFAEKEMHKINSQKRRMETSKLLDAKYTFDTKITVQTDKLADKLSSIKNAAPSDINTVIKRSI